MGKKHKAVLLQVGRTPEGRSIWHGVYAFYETHGLPLSDLLFQLWGKDGMPDWEQLVLDMHAAGRPFPRCIEAVCAAVTDACYPVEIRDRIVDRIQEIKEPPV